MAISAEEVRQIARLARLHVSEDEVKLYQGQLGKILESMEELKKADTRGVSPGSHILARTIETREDVQRPFSDVEGLLSQAPEREGPYFKVRKIIE